MSARKQGQPTTSEVMEALDQVMDPEIPVVSVIGMGLIRDVSVTDDGVTVQLTPTFSGCPALHVIRADIESKVRSLGVDHVTVETVLNPPWTSDWISEEARSKLKAFGLAPPPVHGGRVELIFFDQVNCPYCDSEDTILKNGFGPTLCRAIYYCRACQQPFEQFKAL